MKAQTKASRRMTATNNQTTNLEHFSSYSKVLDPEYCNVKPMSSGINKFKMTFDFGSVKVENDDINDMYIVSDIIMTDYSSVFFDFANLKRPMLFYMYDLDIYKGKLRDFYLDLEELPGPIAETQEDLEKNLKNIDKEFKKNKTKYEKFNKKFNYLDDGASARRVINVIFNLKEDK